MGFNLARIIADNELASFERLLKVRSPIVSEALQYEVGKAYFIPDSVLAGLTKEDGTPKYSANTLKTGVINMLTGKTMEKRGLQYEVSRLRHKTTGESGFRVVRVK